MSKAHPPVPAPLPASQHGGPSTSGLSTGVCGMGGQVDTWTARADQHRDACGSFWRERGVRQNQEGFLEEVAFQQGLEGS